MTNFSFDDSTSNDSVSWPQKKWKTVNNSMYGLHTNTNGSVSVKYPDSDDVAEAIEAKLNDPTAKEIDGREREKVIDRFYDAKHFVQANGSDLTNYVWCISAASMPVVRDLFDLYTDSDETGLTVDMGQTFELASIPFLQAAYLPEGWMLLVKQNRLTRDGSMYHPEPFALVKNIDAGYPETIPVGVGGEIDIRVVNAWR